MDYEFELVLRNNKLNVSELGFTNYGNTCYLNSFLQCLLSTKDFVKIFLTKDFLISLSQNILNENENFMSTEKFNEKKKSTLTYQLYELIFKIWTNNNFVNEHRILTQYITHEYRFGYAQQDTDDFMIKFFNSIHVEVLQTYKIGENNALNDKSLISQLFQYKTQSIILCHNQFCGYKSNTMNNTLKLFVYNNNNNNNIDIDLNNFMKTYYQNPEKLTDYKCEQCGQTNVTKEYKIISTPKYFIISFKRFSYTTWGNKLTYNVHYFDNISINGDNFQLYGIIKHIGINLQFGHYISRCRHIYDNKWYEFDDRYVHELPNNNHIDPQAYVLFYEKIK